MQEIKKYPHYKSSNIAWLGDIPEHWEYAPLKRKTKIRRGASPRPIDNPIYFDEEGEFCWVRISDVTAANKYLLKTRERLSNLGASLSVKRYENDLILSIAATVGVPILIKIKCCIHDGFLTFDNLKFHNEYLYYLFLCGEMYKGLGKEGTQLNLNSDTVGMIVLPFPPLAEQKAIADYLDKKNEQIARFIANKTRLIELLKEEKTAYVTELMQQAAQNHEAKKLKYLVKINPSRNYSGVKLVEGEKVVFLPMENVSEDGKISNELKKPIEEVCQGYTFFARNDVVLAKITPCFENGKAAWLNELESHFGFGTTEFHVFRASRKILPQFLYQVFKTERFMNTGEKLMVGSAGQKRVPSNFVANYIIHIPPISEQEGIVKKIQAKHTQIDAVIGRIQREIAFMKEYKTALISEAVTGKICITAQL